MYKFQGLVWAWFSRTVSFHSADGNVMGKNLLRMRLGTRAIISVIDHPPFVITIFWGGINHFHMRGLWLLLLLPLLLLLLVYILLYYIHYHYCYHYSWKIETIYYYHYYHYDHYYCYITYIIIITIITIIFTNSILCFARRTIFRSKEMVLPKTP